MMSSDKQYIYGIHTVQSYLENFPQEVAQLWLLEGNSNARLQKIAEVAATMDLPVRWCDRQALDELTNGANHQGVVIQIKSTFVFDEQALLQQLANNMDECLLLILDGVQDPHNLGACLRSADAFGVTAVVIPKRRAVGVTPVVRKVASGAAETIPVVAVTNLARFMEKLQGLGIWLVGLDAEIDTAIREIDLTGPVAMVLGSEGSGLRRLTKEHCDYLAKIPMMGTVASINVSVATGICLYEATRQRLSLRE